jgi:hypothetical protein
LPAPPAAQRFWVARASGTGTQTVTWPGHRGDWAVVVANADGSPGVSAHIQAGATVPALGWVAFGVLGTGVLLFAGGAALLGVAAYRAAHDRAPPADSG